MQHCYVPVSFSQQFTGTDCDKLVLINFQRRLRFFMNFSINRGKIGYCCSISMENSWFQYIWNFISMRSNPGIESKMSEPNSQAPHDTNFGSFAPVENPWRIKHPVVTFFHLLFRTLALIGMKINNHCLTIISSIFSLPPERLVLLILHWEFYSHYPTSESRLLDSEKYNWYGLDQFPLHCL